MTSKRMQFDALVFDFDGTLVDSGASILRAFQYAVAPWKPELRAEDLDAVRGLGRLEIFETLVGTQNAQAALDRLIEAGRTECSSIRLYEGVAELIEAARNSGRRLAIWTARDANSTIEVLRANGVLNHFELIVGNCSVERNKPHPEGLLKISQTLGVSPERILHIGDHDHDITGARGAGCQVIGVRWPSDAGKTAGFSETPDAYFECPKRLRDFISHDAL